jgi:hypothetical protein
LIGGARHPQMGVRETHRDVIQFSDRLCQALLRPKKRQSAG